MLIEAGHTCLNYDAAQGSMYAGLDGCVNKRTGSRVLQRLAFFCGVVCTRCVLVCRFSFYGLVYVTSCWQAVTRPLCTCDCDVMQLINDYTSLASVYMCLNYCVSLMQPLQADSVQLQECATVLGTCSLI